jgi:hypothetical protein
VCYSWIRLRVSLCTFIEDQDHLPLVLSVIIHNKPVIYSV